MSKSQQYDLPHVKPAPPKKAAYEPFQPGPNPALPDFIRRHSTPYDPATDQYDVPAFDRDILVDKAQPPKAIYDMHTYWSKKHWAAIREYIGHYLPDKYYPKGTGLVLDCFSGSGMTGVAAMMQDRPCVLVDASPAAAFISHCCTHPIDPEDLQGSYDGMLAEPYPAELRVKLKKITGQDLTNLQQELDWLYETKCDRCGGPATTEYIVYSERFQCLNCAEVVALYDCPEIKAPKKALYCPNCLARNHGEPSREFAISTRSKKFGAIPVKVVYECIGKCRPKRGERLHNEDQRTRKGRYFYDCDVAKIAQIEKAAIPHWFPQRKMMDVEDNSKPWGVEWRPGRNFRTVAELYTRRNLWALSAYAESRRMFARECEWLDIPLSACSLSCSRLLTEANRQITKGTYYIPQISRAIKFMNGADYRMKVLTGVQKGLLSASNAGRTISSCDSALDLQIGPALVDYAFLDPPYVGTVQYGELNFIWEAWLDFPGGWRADEIVINAFRNKGINDWDRDLRRALARVFESLKPGRWLSLCYHDTDPGTWSRLQDILLDVGFEICTVTVLDPKQKSSNQTTAEKVVKSDLVLNCRKPRVGQTRAKGDGSEAELVSHRVREILIETLSKIAGQDRDKLWDAILKRLLSRGQMAEHRFEDILSDVAFRSESGRWFLKEEFEQLSQSDIKNEEDAGTAIERFTRLRSIGVPADFAANIALHKPSLAGAETDEGEVEKYIVMHLIQDPMAKRFKLSGRLRGVEFYDCLFFYLTRFLKGRPGGKTPRRNLAEFLEEYLVHFKDGDKWLYRPPDRLEAETLRKSRQTGLGRRIRQYSAFLRGDGDFPKEKLPDSKTLLAWLKYSSTFGLAEEGVLLFEKGGLQLQPGTDDYYDADEYYRNCKRKSSKPKEDEAEDEDRSEEVEE
jgi:hypothetical protein